MVALNQDYPLKKTEAGPKNRTRDFFPDRSSRARQIAPSTRISTGENYDTCRRTAPGHSKFANGALSGAMTFVLNTLKHESTTRVGFNAEEEAGIAASREARTLTEATPGYEDSKGVAREYEFSGEIYSYEENGKTLYAYTRPRQNEKGYYQNGKFYNKGDQISSRNIPKGADFLGGYHSHPGNSSFSTLDKTAVKQSGKTLYLGRGIGRDGVAVEVLRPTKQYRQPSSKYKYGLWKYKSSRIYDSRKN